MKAKGPTILTLLIFLAGLSLFFYPSFSNYQNSLHQAQTIADYDKDTAQLTEEKYARLWTEAREWNHTIAHTSYVPEEDLLETYYDLLDPNDRNVMGYLEIPTIGIILPVGHGTGEDVLQKSVGHLEWSSLPVGGEGSHCVLSGHCGLPSAKLLTDLDRLEVGDRFSLHVLDETLDYAVDHISVVAPDDFSLLGKEEGKDLVTLVTCTPYGINSHRLLVRGERTNQTAPELNREACYD